MSDLRRMTRMTARLICWMLVLACVASRPARAREFEVPTSPESRVHIRIKSWLDACPPNGCAPLLVKIANESARGGTWTTHDGYETGAANSFTFSVEAGKTAEIVIHPVVGMGRSGSSMWRSMNFTVSGPGVRAHSDILQHPDTLRSSATKDSMPFLGVSREVARDIWTPLSEFFEKAAGGPRSFDATKLDMSAAPEDWRGYSGLMRLWITDGEWSAMSTAAKGAMMEWIALGGELTVFCQDVSEARLATLKIPAADATGRRSVGAGSVKVTARDPKSVAAERLAKMAAPDAEVASMPQQLEGYSGFKLIDRVGRPHLRAGLIFGFIAIFGTLVGPLNILWFSGHGRRQRIFWVTPLLSLAGSGLLIMLMIFQDGIGGDGARRVLALMLPSQNKLAIVQEQVSRTGVLLGRSFSHDGPSWMQDVNIDSGSSAYTPRQARHRALAEDAAGRAGDWFESRSVQAQVLKSVRASREQIELFPSSPGKPPSVLSSVSMPLTRVFIVDEKRQVWQAEKVGTGEKKEMKPATVDDLNRWLHSQGVAEAGPLISSAIRQVRFSAGVAFAESPDAARVAVKTLGSIRWNDDRVIFAGPYVKHTQP